MNESQSQTAITTSALVVGGFYVYRAAAGHVKNQAEGKSRSGEKQTVQSAGKGVLGLSSEPLPVGTFVTGWGVTYIGISILGSVNADLGGYFAILVAVSAAIGNLKEIMKDLHSGFTEPLEKSVKEHKTEAKKAG